MKAATPTNSSKSPANLAQCETAYAAVKQRGLKLDMTRGKPSSEQLDLAAGPNTILPEGDYKAADGSDARKCRRCLPDYQPRQRGRRQEAPGHPDHRS